MEQAPEIRVDGVRVAAVDKKRAALYLGCPKLVEQLLWVSRHHFSDPWITIVANEEGTPKAKTLIDARSLERAYARLLAGDCPPKMGEDCVTEFSANGTEWVIGREEAVNRHLAKRKRQMSLPSRLGDL